MRNQVDWKSLGTAARKTEPREWIDAWVKNAAGQSQALTLPPLPPMKEQTLPNGKSGERAMKHAGRFYQLALKEMNDRLENTRDLVILDLGCGWGRIASLFLRHARPRNIHCADVDPRVLRTGRNFLPALSWQKIDPMQPLPYKDGMFDVVFSNSVLSHLSPEAHIDSVTEVARVLRKGGLFFTTTLGPRHLDPSNERPRKWMPRSEEEINALRTELQETGFAYFDTKRKWGNYGIALVNQQWIKANWPESLDHVAVHQNYTQDFQVAVKR